MCQHYVVTFIKLYIYCSVERNSQDNILYYENTTANIGNKIS